MANKKTTVSVSLRLSRTECGILRRLSWEAKRSGGRKLPHSVMLRALIRLSKELDIDLAGVKTAAQLKKRLMVATGR